MTPLRICRRILPDKSQIWPSHVHPVLQRIYTARGITDAAQIEHRLAALAPPNTMGGMDRACELLIDALANNKRIVVVGDFDADGATGTAVAVRGLRLLGARHVNYRVPNRFLHGYGLSAALVETFADDLPNLLITVDNGIASHAGITAAQALGMQIIVTDHHLPGETLPSADVIVNPNLAGDAFLSKALCGVGVMFYLLLALRARLREISWFTQQGIGEPDLAILLDLVALGTVADLVSLDFNNRILVEAGLKRIRSGRACAGIRALIEVSKRREENITASDLGYALAPRINAAGRLEDMSVGIECLLTDDVTHAGELATRLSTINEARRELQSDMSDQGEASINKWMAKYGRETLPVGMVLFEPEWHIGVVGLVASRLKEKFHRPVVACAPTGDGTEIRASARSISGFHIRDALAEVDARYPGLISRFGGHAMAAGLMLEQQHLAAFAEAFDIVARERIAREQLEPVLHTDGELAPEYFNFELAQQLRFAGPWGQAFPEPSFDNEFEMIEWKVIGETHLRLKLRASNGSIFEAVMFGGYTGKPPPQRLRAVFQLDINEWRGVSSLQLMVRHFEKIVD